MLRLPANLEFPIAGITPIREWAGYDSRSPIDLDLNLFFSNEPEHNHSYNQHQVTAKMT